MNNSERELLETIFSDADLVDVDFAQWDTGVNLFVLADHVSATRHKKPLWVVRLGGVREFNWKFRHHDFSDYPLKHDPQLHLVWNIYHLDLSVEGKLSRICIRGAEQFPTIEIVFEKLVLQEIDHAVFSEINPNWAKLNHGMGRPGIEALSKLWRQGTIRTDR
jgi:hypothetical protein